MSQGWRLSCLHLWKRQKVKEKNFPPRSDFGMQSVFATRRWKKKEITKKETFMICFHVDNELRLKCVPVKKPSVIVCLSFAIHHGWYLAMFIWYLMGNKRARGSKTRIRFTLIYCRFYRHVKHSLDLNSTCLNANRNSALWANSKRELYR